jgi:hypothetical protein
MLLLILCVLQALQLLLKAPNTAGKCNLQHDEDWHFRCRSTNVATSQIHILARTRLLRRRTVLGFAATEKFHYNVSLHLQTVHDSLLMWKIWNYFAAHPSFRYQDLECAWTIYNWKVMLTSRFKQPSRACTLAPPWQVEPCSGALLSLHVIQDLCQPTNLQRQIRSKTDKNIALAHNLTT